MADPITQDLVEQDEPCTDCGGTGFTFQTERRCASQSQQDLVVTQDDVDRAENFAFHNPRAVENLDQLIRFFARHRIEAIEKARPLNMVLYCPYCGLQHIDEPDERTPEWTNPPHRSHLCHGCGCIWRPADVPTNGVRAVETKGKADTWPLAGNACSAIEKARQEALEEANVKLRMIISHASGGHLSEPEDVDRSVNDICVEISRHHNRVWQHAQEVALRDQSLMSSSGGGGA